MTWNLWIKTVVKYVAVHPLGALELIRDKCSVTQDFPICGSTEVILHSLRFYIYSCGGGEDRITIYRDGRALAQLMAGYPPDAIHGVVIEEETKSSRLGFLSVTYDVYARTPKWLN